MLHSVRLRLILSFLLVGLAAALTVGLVTLLIANSYFRQQEIESLTRNADEIASHVRSILEREGYGAEDESGRNLRAAVQPTWTTEQQLQTAVLSYSFLGQKRVAVLNGADTVLADSGEGSPFQLVELDLASSYPSRLIIHYVDSLNLDHVQSFPPFRVRPGEFGWGYALTSLDRSGGTAPTPEEGVPDLLAGTVVRSNLIVKVPVQSRNGEEIGHIQLSEGPAYGQPILRGIRLALGGGLAAAVVLALAVGIFSARQLTRPLAALGAAAERMAAGDLSARAPNHRRDEFGQLARRFNRMAERLQATVDRLAADREALRRFIADASHELRTPLTALKTFNAIWSRDPKMKARPEAAMLQANAEQIERLDALTQGLLDLSRLDADLSPDDFVCEDVRAPVRRAESAFRPLMEEKGLDLTLDVPEAPAVVSYNLTYLRRAVDNLLNNACKFTPAGGRVSLGLEQGEEEVRIWVHDSGPGIPSDELPYIFDRFYRGGGAAGSEGSGLGLAIVQAVAQAHHGRVTVDCTSGCRFTLHLPRPEWADNHS